MSTKQRVADMNPRARSWALKMYKEESVSESVPVWPDGQIVFQNLAIYNNEKLSKRIKIVPKWVQHFNKYEINRKNIAKDVLIIFSTY